jgi:molybdopterin-guanine dinucleotide biosynthesis protein B
MASYGGGDALERRRRIIAFVGASGVGKTTVIERVVRELTQRGYRVGVLKHDCHGFEMDRPGKDTWRFTQAGAAAVAIASPNRLALLEQLEREWTPAEVAALFQDRVDIILCEGYKAAALPKIAVLRAGHSTQPLCAPDDLIAVVSDVPTGMPVPHFDLDDIPAIANFVATYQAQARSGTVPVDVGQEGSHAVVR